MNHKASLCKCWFLMIRFWTAILNPNNWSNWTTRSKHDRTKVFWVHQKCFKQCTAGSLDLCLFFRWILRDTLENLISVLTWTTLHYKTPSHHGLLGYLHAQWHPRRGRPRLPFFENVPNFKLFTVSELKTNQIVFKSKVFSSKEYFCSKEYLCSKNGGFAVFSLKMPLDIGIMENPLEHAY